MATSEKIQLKGASQYKKDLAQITAQSKALASEMKLVKSSFDKTTTAEEKNQKISEQLAKQIENQQKLVEKRTQAYQEAAAKFGEESTQALKAKDAMIQAQVTLNDMERESRELAQAETELTQTEEEETAAVIENEGAHSRLSGVLKAAGAAVAAVAAAAAAAAKALWDATNAAGQWADNLLTLSAQTDVSVDTLQRWDYAARFIDTDTQSMTKALAKVVSQQGAAIKSGEDYITTLDGQQIALKDANGEYKSSEEVFYSMIDALGQIEDPTMRDAAAQDLFGKSFQEMKPLIDAGSEGLKAYGDEAERLGLIMDGEAVNALGAFDDQMQKLKATTETAGRELALAFLPVTQEIAESLTDLASTVTKALSDGFQDTDVGTILDALFGKLSEGLSNLSEIMPAVAKFVTGLALKIVDFVTQNGPLLMNTALQIILGIVNGFAENLPVMIPSIVEMIMTIVNTLMAPENVTLLMDAAIALMQGLGQGLINATPVLIAQLPTLVMNMVRSLIAQAPQMFQLGPQFIAQFSLGFASAIGGLANQLKEWVRTKIIEVVKNMASKMSPAGQALVQGLWQGISDKMAWMKQQISKWVDNIKDFFKKLLGIHSPSTVFEGYGNALVDGLVLGWQNGLKDVRSAMGAVPSIGADITTDASPYGFGGSVINIYPQQMDNSTIDYIYAKVNARMGAAV